MMALLFVDTWTFNDPDEKDTVPCELDSPSQFPHYRFWVIQRRAAGQLGHFMIFRINGIEHVVDASVPTRLRQLPRDAVEITGELREKILHHTCGSHSWGCCFLKEVLAIAKPNPGGKRRFQQYTGSPW